MFFRKFKEFWHACLALSPVGWARPILLLLFLVMISCGRKNKTSNQLKTPSYTTKEISDSITIDHHVRHYILRVPQGPPADSLLPLVFVLHGARGNPQSIERLSEFHRQSKKEPFITVYPASEGKFWDDGRANVNPRINDVKFINRLVDTLETQYPVNERAIFAMGMSNGATMSVRLACQSHDIKAVATVASTAVMRIINNCNPAGPKSAMLIKGTKDPVANFSGVEKRKRHIAGYDYTVGRFLAIDGCDSEYVSKPFPDLVDDGMRSNQKRYGKCLDNAEVVSIVVKNGGHTWPGGPQLRSKLVVGHTTYDFSASKVIWQFFKRHITTNTN